MKTQTRELLYRVVLDLENDNTAAMIGRQIAKELHLKKKDGRYNLANGTKTDAGLARTIYRMFAGDWNN